MEKFHKPDHNTAAIIPERHTLEEHDMQIYRAACWHTLVEVHVIGGLSM